MEIFPARKEFNVLRREEVGMVEVRVPIRGARRGCRRQRRRERRRADSLDLVKMRIPGSWGPTEELMEVKVEGLVFVGAEILASLEGVVEESELEKSELESRSESDSIS